MLQLFYPSSVFPLYTMGLETERRNSHALDSKSSLPSPNDEENAEEQEEEEDERKQSDLLLVAAGKTRRIIFRAG